MYREKDLMDCLYGLIGWRQNFNPDYADLTPSLLESESGLYFQDEHPLIAIENIDQAIANFDKYNYPMWNGGSLYPKGARVRSMTDGQIYEAKEEIESAGQEPSVSPTIWLVMPLLSQKLEAITRSAINKVAAQLFQNKKLREVTKSLFENVQLFSGNGSLIDKEIKNDRFVGFRVALRDQRDLIAIIRRIGMQFTSTQNEFRIFIYHSSQEAPVKILNLQRTKINSFEWANEIDYDLRHLDQINAPGGSFRIGYYETYLQGQAINRGYLFGTAPQCSTCNNWHSLWSQWSKFVSIEPFYVNLDIIPQEDGSDALLWDTSLEKATPDKSYGLNFDFSVRCDVTDFFCRERTLFTQAILKQVSYDVLHTLAYAVRNNVISKEVRELAMYAIETKPNGNPGARKQLDLAIEALDFDTTGLNEVCLPCAESGFAPTYTSF